MDFGGNWRLLHYTMKATYAPFLISAHHNKSSGIVQIWATSDINRPVAGVHKQLLSPILVLLLLIKMLCVVILSWC